MESSSEEDKNLVKKVNKCVVETVKCANTLPSIGGDYELLASFPKFSEFMQVERSRILDLSKRLLRQAGCKVKLPENDEDSDELLDKIIEANDVILERVSNCLDEASGIRNSDGVVDVPKHIETAESTLGSSKTGFKIPLKKKKKYDNLSPASSTIPNVKHQISRKPQLNFKDYIDNSSSPFVPKLSYKHHAKIRKASNVVVLDDEASDSNATSWTSDQQESDHPYQYELDHFEVAEEQLMLGNIQEVLPIEETPLVCVDTLEGLNELRDELNRQTEFAIDLEHNDYRSYLGLTCLVQVSTRKSDYIIDPFPIWSQMHILNEPFTNPAILKVFHGSNMDIQWLQRDFGIYVVNMFDTGRAMRCLNFQKFSLLFLVQKYCSVTLCKEFQQADWRIRPLPDDFVDYARRDTHYLLYCYDRLITDLIEQGNEMKNLLNSVYDASRDICRSIYVKPVFDPEGYRKFITLRKTFNNRQMFALKELWRWRDEMARSQDESLAYVLPDHMLLQIGEVLPREMQGIYACCNPVPSLVKHNLIDLHRIVLKARDRPLELKPILNTCEMGSTSNRQLTVLSDHMSWLRSPHDFSFTKKDEEIPPVASRIHANKTEWTVPEKKKAKLDHGEEICQSIVTVKKRPTLYLFDRVNKEQNDGDLLAKKLSAIKQSLDSWASPFDRYRVALDRLRELAEDDKEKKKEEQKNEDTGGNNKKKTELFSHHDQSSGHGFIAADIAEKEISEETAKDSEKQKDANFFDDMILTRKDLKKKRKRAAAAKDMSIESNEQVGVDQNEDGRVKAGEKNVKKKSKWMDDQLLDTVSPVDYSQYSADIFSAKPKTTDSTYNPYNERHSGKGRSRGGRGKFHQQRGKRFHSNNKSKSKTQTFGI